jgi:hypothetical protein
LGIGLEEGTDFSIYPVIAILGFPGSLKLEKQVWLKSFFLQDALS